MKTFLTGIVAAVFAALCLTIAAPAAGVFAAE